VAFWEWKDHGKDRAGNEINCQRIEDKHKKGVLQLR
jgi:hypothetical protein